MRTNDLIETGRSQTCKARNHVECVDDQTCFYYESSFEKVRGKDKTYE